MTAPTQPEPEPTPESRVEPETPPHQAATSDLAQPAAPESLATSAATAAPVEAYAPTERVAIPAQPLTAPERETVFVPMSVTIGDGFKFGCGFFLALVLAMLVGFVLLAALFALTSLFGLNLPITR
jgi:hypothetical protein